MDVKNELIYYDIKFKIIKLGLFYMNNGFWDILKIVYVLFFVLVLEFLFKFLVGFLISYNEIGFLLCWLVLDEWGMMFGNLVDLIIVESVKKGIVLEFMFCLLVVMCDSDLKLVKNFCYGW